MIVAFLCACKSKELYDWKYKSNKFQYIPNFWEWVFNYNLKFRNVFVILKPLVVDFRNRHQYKVTFSCWYSIIFEGGGWEGDRILKNRF